MPVDHGKLYTHWESFFEPRGSIIMLLSPEAAIEVCERAASRGFIVVRYEGGIKRGTVFEARLDCIWDGRDPPLTVEEAHANNLRAANELKKDAVAHNAFVITTAFLHGYMHKIEAE